MRSTRSVTTALRPKKKSESSSRKGSRPRKGQRSVTAESSKSVSSPRTPRSMAASAFPSSLSSRRSTHEFEARNPLPALPPGSRTGITGNSVPFFPSSICRPRATQISRCCHGPTAGPRNTAAARQSSTAFSIWGIAGRPERMCSSSRNVDMPRASSRRWISRTFSRFALLKLRKRSFIPPTRRLRDGEMIVERVLPSPPYGAAPDHALVPPLSKPSVKMGATWMRAIRAAWLRSPARTGRPDWRVAPQSFS